MKIVNRSVLRSALFAPACLLAGAGASAQSLSLQNASFEDPFIDFIDTSDPQVASQLPLVMDLVTARFILGPLITIDRFNGPPTDGRYPTGPVVYTPLTDPQIGWIQTGPTFDPGIPDIPPSNSSGIFSNQSLTLDPSFPPLLRSISNTTGVDATDTDVNTHQLGFLLADPFANGVDEDFVSIYQESTDVFEENTRYRFSLDVGQAVTFAAGAEAPLRIAIGVLDDSFDTDDSGIFQEIDGRGIVASPLFQPENDLDNSGAGTLRHFFVDVDTAAIDPMHIGQNIAIQIRVDVSPDLGEDDLFNVGGAFNVDNARLLGGLLGDLNGDGELTDGDISAFVLGLTEPGEYASTYAGLTPGFVGDFNSDGVLTNGDIQGFVDLFQGLGFDTSAVPEPTSLALLGLGGMLLVRRRR